MEDQVECHARLRFLWARDRRGDVTEGRDKVPGTRGSKALVDGLDGWMDWMDGSDGLDWIGLDWIGLD